MMTSESTIPAKPTFRAASSTEHTITISWKLPGFANFTYLAVDPREGTCSETCTVANVKTSEISVAGLTAGSGKFSYENPILQ